MASSSFDPKVNLSLTLLSSFKHYSLFSAKEEKKLKPGDDVQALHANGRL